MGPERKLESWCVKYARSQGAWLLKWRCPGHRGLPDRILIRPDIQEISFLEFKSPKGKLSMLQEIWRSRIGFAVIRTKEQFHDLFKNEI